MRTATFLVLLILFPSITHASVIITEIMYDLPGTDTGREWIEITNTGNSSVDVSGYKFFEANTNHSPTLISGNGTLQPGDSAVIADDHAKFKTDWPNYSGTLFDSSFSLSNTGEPLALKDSALTVIDSVSYDPSIGAAGDGNSLQLVNSNWIASAPTPGSVNAGVLSNTSDSQTSSSTPSAASSGGSIAYTPPPSALSIKIDGTRNVLSEVPLHLSARVTTKSGDIDSLAQISWSFGDGSSSSGSAVEKTYHYAGTYLITVDATDGAARAHDDLVVIVRSAKVRILSISGDGITIANDSSERLDLSGWRLSLETGSFRIPNGMIILPESSVMFPFAVMNLSIAFDATLSYPNGGTAVRYSPQLIVAVATTSASIPEQPSQVVASYRKVQVVEPIISVKKNIQAHEETVNAPAAATELAAAGATSASSSQNVGGFFRSPWTLGFLSIMTLAGGAFIFL